ncbi:MAG: hypothetical protein A2Z14_04370 [Chloroflexi bacterium RBG_16_48_8]|nr:MAG: hypothetical protein A2Z14_04370 [Chloroflexi bacterium RBG_16_48_8]
MSVGHRPKINAVFDVIVGIRKRNIANDRTVVGMRLVKFGFCGSLSLKLTGDTARNVIHVV